MSAALTAVRSALSKAAVGLCSANLGNLLSAPSTSQLCLQPSRTLKAKTVRDIDPTKTPPPWPYKEVGYDWKAKIMDYTRKRLTENSKLIVVEGNIGSGKSTLARDVADRLDFYFIPERTMDHIFINSYGTDVRNFYQFLPPSCRVPDIKMFYENPENPLVHRMQEHMFFMKYEAYMNALAHILNTGQGVVMERSPHSDFCFVNAMRQKGFLSHEYMRRYYYQRKLVLPELHFWPHLIIYLDTPVPECLDRIKKRRIPEENNGKVIDLEYLDTINESYKDMIREADPHSHMLMYDWNVAGDVDQVVEDIEKLDLDFFEWHSGEKLEEWGVIRDGMEWNDWRRTMTYKHNICSIFTGVPTHEVEALNISPDDYDQYVAALKKYVYGPYQVGYNVAKGDSAWKIMMTPDRWFQPTTIVPWYEHFFKDAWYENTENYRTWMDRFGDYYDEHYGHGH